MAKGKRHWKRVAGIDLFKVEYRLKQWLYKCFGITLPKLRDQSEYWQWRGEGYCDEITSSGYLDREVFFQNMIVDELASLSFNSAFEAGCGFGWNIRRIKELWPDKRVGGLDFSLTQLKAGEQYTAGLDLTMVHGDATNMPFKDNEFDVGFSLGVFMNIHPTKIAAAAQEMMRVCGRYILHMEWADKHATKELVEKRAFKTNIVPHDYEAIYSSLGARLIKRLTHEDFGDTFRAHEQRVSASLDRWEGFEGPDKYTFYVFKV